MNQDREPRKGRTEGVGDPAEERTVAEAPPPVDEKLIERMHRLEKEIAEDERSLREEVPPQQ